MEKATKQYRYRFAEFIEDEAIAETLLLTSIATRSLHGGVRTPSGVRHRYNAKKRECMIDAENAAGRDFNRILTGFLESEFGGGSFIVERVDKS